MFALNKLSQLDQLKIRLIQPHVELGNIVLNKLQCRLNILKILNILLILASEKMYRTSLGGQEKLGQAKSALPSDKLWSSSNKKTLRLSSINKNIEVCQQIEVILMYQKIEVISVYLKI